MEAPSLTKTIPMRVVGVGGGIRKHVEGGYVLVGTKRVNEALKVVVRVRVIARERLCE